MNTHDTLEVVIALLEMLSETRLYGQNERESIIQRGLEWLKHNSTNTVEVLRLSKLFNSANTLDNWEITKPYCYQQLDTAQVHKSDPNIIDVSFGNINSLSNARTLTTRALNLGQRLLFKKQIPKLTMSTTEDCNVVLQKRDIYIVVTIEEWHHLWKFIDSLKSRAHLAEEENKIWLQYVGVSS